MKDKSFQAVRTLQSVPVVIFSYCKMIAIKRHDYAHLVNQVCTLLWNQIWWLYLSCSHDIINIKPLMADAFSMQSSCDLVPAQWCTWIVQLLSEELFSQLPIHVLRADVTALMFAHSMQYHWNTGKQNFHWRSSYQSDVTLSRSNIEYLQQIFLGRKHESTDSAALLSALEFLWCVCFQTTSALSAISCILTSNIFWLAVNTK